MLILAALFLAVSPAAVIHAGPQAEGAKKDSTMSKKMMKKSKGAKKMSHKKSMKKTDKKDKDEKSGGDMSK